MTLVGGIELICVALLLFGRPSLRLLSLLVLLVLMVGALYNLYAVGAVLQDWGAAVAGLGFVLTSIYTMVALRSVEIKVKV